VVADANSHSIARANPTRHLIYCDILLRRLVSPNDEWPLPDTFPSGGGQFGTFVDWNGADS